MSNNTNFNIKLYVKIINFDIPNGTNLIWRRMLVSIYMINNIYSILVFLSSRMDLRKGGCDGGWVAQN